MSDLLMYVYAKRVCKLANNAGFHCFVIYK